MTITIIIHILAAHIDSPGKFNFNTAIFSMVNSVILRPLPFDHAERLVKVGSRDADGFWGLVIGPVAVKLFEESTSFEKLSLMRTLNQSLMQDGYAQKIEMPFLRLRIFS